MTSHEKYVTSQGRVDVSGTWILDLHVQVSTELCQEMLPMSLPTSSKINTKLDLLNYFINNKLQANTTKNKYYRTYGIGTINIYKFN